MRPATVITLLLLVLAMFGAILYQLLFLVE